MNSYRDMDREGHSFECSCRECLEQVKQAEIRERQQVHEASVRRQQARLKVAPWRTDA